MIVATIDYPRPRIRGRSPDASFGSTGSEQRPQATAKPAAPPPPPAAAAPPAPPPMPERPIEQYPEASMTWAELIAPDRVYGLPLTDMTGGGYEVNQAWMERAGHPTESVHPNERQRRAVRRFLAVNRILDIANGTNRNAMLRAGIDVPTFDSMLADFNNPGQSPDKFWADLGTNQNKKWHIYKKLEEIARNNRGKVAFLQHAQAADRYKAKGGTMQGYGEPMPTSLAGYRQSFPEALGQSRECRRDRFGACAPEGTGDTFAATEPGVGEPGDPVGGTLQPGPRPGGPRGTLTTQTIDRPRHTLAQYRQGGILGPADPRTGPRGTLQPADPRTGPRGTLQPADPRTGPSGTLQPADPGGGVPGGTSFQQAGSVVVPNSPAATAAMAATASTHYGSAATSNMAGYRSQQLGFSLRDITRPLEQVTKTVFDPFEIRKGRVGIENLADFAMLVGPIASSIPHPYAQTGGAIASAGGATLRSLADKDATGAQRAADMYETLRRFFPGIIGDPVPAYGPPVAPPPPPPAAATQGMADSTKLMLAAGAALAAGMLMARGK